jgi:proline dehydrogenase
MEQSVKLSFEDTRTAFARLSDRQLKKSRLIFSAMQLPWLVKAASAFTVGSLRIGLPGRGLIKNTVFAQFCGGETLDEAAATATVLARYGVGSILDYGVEASRGEAGYDAAAAECIRALSQASRSSCISFVSLKMTAIARFTLLEKIHCGVALSRSEAGELARVRQRLHDICHHAAEKDRGVLIDAEESWIQEPVDTLAMEMMASFNQGRVVVYNTFQLYRTGRLAFLRASLGQAAAAGFLLGAKLVRGAYMEKERRRAAERKEPSPIQPDKAATDHTYDEAVRFCLDRLEDCAAFIGTHNTESCLKAVACMEARGISPGHPRVIFSQLYGMSDQITFNLAAAGYRALKYLPYGPVKEVLPYLVRRAEENSAVSGQAGRELELIGRELARRRGR